MYSEQLEQLIKSVIADGVITEKERAVLHKKAAAEGIDEDEIDVYVDGLVSQKTSQESQTTTIDYKHISKSVDYSDEIFYGIKEYEVRNLPNSLIQSIYLNLVKIIRHARKDGDKDIISWGISVIYCSDSKKEFSLYSDAIMILKTESNSFELKSSYRILGRSKLPNGKEIEHYAVFELDSEIIKLLCDAKHLTMSLYIGYKFRGAESSKETTIKDININRFVSYAQVFYRSVVDNNSYPDSIAGGDDVTKMVDSVIDGNYSYSEAGKKLLKHFMTTKKEELGNLIRNLYD